MQSLSKLTGQSGGALFQELHVLSLHPRALLGSQLYSACTVTLGYSSIPHVPPVFKTEILHTQPGMVLERI